MFNIKKIKGILLDGIKEQVVEVDNDIESLHDLLNCSILGFTSRVIVGRKYVVIYDDVGSLKDNIVTSLYINEFFDFEVAFVGKIFVVSECNYLDDICSLSDDDIQHLLFNCKDGILFIY